MKTKFTFRPYKQKDLEQLVRLQKKCYPEDFLYDKELFLSHMRLFPEGTIAVEDPGGKIIASASTMIVDLVEDEDHTWLEETDNGRITSHNPDGDTLYGVNIAIDPEYRQQGLGKQIYEKLFSLVKEHGLKQFFIAIRMPGYHSFYDELSPIEYLHLVEAGKIVDPDITPAIKIGLHPFRVAREYLPFSDFESHDYVVYMSWMKEEEDAS